MDTPKARRGYGLVFALIPGILACAFVLFRTRGYMTAEEYMWVDILRARGTVNLFSWNPFASESLETFFRPLSYYPALLFFRAFQWNAPGARTLGLLLMVANALLFFTVLVQLHWPRASAALAAAILLISSPTVCCLGFTLGIHDSMMAFCCLLGTVCGIQFLRASRRSAQCLSFVGTQFAVLGALYSKEAAIFALPAMVSAACLMFRSRRALLLALATVSWVGLFTWARWPQLIALATTHPSYRPKVELYTLHQALIWLTYVFLVPLSDSWALAARPHAWWMLLPTLAGLGILLYALALLKKEDWRLPLVFALLYCIALPVSLENFAPYQLYFSAFPLAALLAWLRAKAPSRGARGVFLLGIVLLAAHSLWTAHELQRRGNFLNNLVHSWDAFAQPLLENRQPVPPVLFRVSAELARDPLLMLLVENFTTDTRLWRGRTLNQPLRFSTPGERQAPAAPSQTTFLLDVSGSLSRE